VLNVRIIFEHEVNDDYKLFMISIDYLFEIIPLQPYTTSVISVGNYVELERL
jgi:hypothetical protein